MSSGEAVRRDPAPRLPYDQRNSQLLDVAEELFVTRGYSAVTMEDIARAAGVSRPVVYRHFDTREGAYLACVSRARERYEHRLVANLAEHQPGRERLEVGADQFFRMLEEDHGKWRLLFGSNPVLPGEYTQTLAELRFGTIRIIEAALREAAPDAPDLIVESAAHAMSGVGERLGHWWFTRPDLTREQLVEIYVDFVVGGVGPYMVD